ncbi:MAG: hydroxyacylglutathione hydrolase [Deltaproteobacteria bacterium]|nr:hydroxyacylglutathione hydrolase [Deltaproteobacteria bacterium]
MRVVQIPTLFDNYTYLVICEKTGVCGIVDSPDAEATWKVIQKEGCDPAAILSTHHHLDHVGGNTDLVRRKKMAVYGGTNDSGRIPELTRPVKEGDTVQVGSTVFNILDIPGHTRGHIAYVAINEIPSPLGGDPIKRDHLHGGQGEGAVFCGDTLFAGGCGRLFEGTPQQMVESLTKLKNLPDGTKVYCGHEYTQKNLEFAKTLEPNNKALQRKYEEVLKKRERGEATVPTTIGEEKSYNPFLRWDSPELIGSLKKKETGLKQDPVSVFAAVRALKDRF